MTLNPGKCHFMTIGQDTLDEDVFLLCYHNNDVFLLCYHNLTLNNSNEEEMLGITIDR